MIKKLQNNRNLPFVCAALLSFFWWIYLYFSTTMQISSDAIGYERLGILIYDKGWIEFLKTGPNREPLFPFLISVSNHIAAWLGVGYQPIQKICHILILFLSQFLLFMALRKLKMRDGLILGVLLYFGFSPGITNSAFSLFSEIATYPFMLAVILTFAVSWQAVQGQSGLKIISCAILLAALFICLIAVKAIFEPILFIFLLFYVATAISALARKNLTVLRNCLLFVFCVILITEGCLLSYRALNFKYNHHFALTDRGTMLLYGNAAKRVENLQGSDYLAGLSSIIGENICSRFFGEDKCAYWSFKAADGYGFAKLAQTRQLDADDSKTDSLLIDAALKKVLEKPFQYALLSIMEGFKVFFWESTKIGFVAYPPWLEKLYEMTAFKNTLRLCVSLLTLWSVLTFIARLFKKRSNISENENIAILRAVLYFCFAYTAMYSLFTIVGRYSLTLAPLFLILIGFSFEKSLAQKH